MTWAKLDDRANEHPKQLEAGAEACWLWACGLMYANRQDDRDGFIPHRAVAVLYPFASATRLITKLLRVGLWKRDQNRDGYLIHNYSKWNQTKEQRESELAAGRARAAKSYAEKKPNRVNSTGEEIPKKTEDTGEDNPKKQTSSGPSPLHSDSTPDQIRAIVEQEPDISDSDLASFTPGVQQPFKQEVLEVFEAWRLATGHPNARLDAKRRTRILARLREGFTVVQLVDAVKHRVNDPFLMGSGGRVYDGIETLLRDAAQVERLVALTKPIQAPQGKPHGFVQHEQRQQQERSTAPQKLFAPDGAEARKALRNALYEAASAGKHGPEVQAQIAAAQALGPDGRRALSSIVDELERKQRSEPTGLGEMLPKVGT